MLNREIPGKGNTHEHSTSRARVQVDCHKMTSHKRRFIESTLRKHAYSNILKILPPKNENFQMKNSDIFHISAQNIDCGYSLEPPRRGGSNEYP